MLWRFVCKRNSLAYPGRNGFNREIRDTLLNRDNKSFIGTRTQRSCPISGGEDFGNNQFISLLVRNFSLERPRQRVLVPQPDTLWASRRGRLGERWIKPPLNWDRRFCFKGSTSGLAQDRRSRFANPACFGQAGAITTSIVYDAKWTIFSDWCVGREIDPFKISVQQLADFLVFFIEVKCLAPSTVVFA
jgi:hypothetical protein